jgi:hypothetical protein
MIRIRVRPDCPMTSARHLIEVVAGNATGIRRALEVAEASAHDHGAALEVVDNDDD